MDDSLQYSHWFDLSQVDHRVLTLNKILEGDVLRYCLRHLASSIIIQIKKDLEIRTHLNLALLHHYS